MWSYQFPCEAPYHQWTASTEERISFPALSDETRWEPFHRWEQGTRVEAILPNTSKMFTLSRPLCVARFGQRFVNFCATWRNIAENWKWFIGESVVRHLRLQVCLKHWEEDCRLKSVICLKDCSLTLKNSSEQYLKKGQIPQKMEGDPERHSINANRAITDGKTLEPKTSLKPKIRTITWLKPGKTPEGGMELWHSVATSGLRILGLTQASLHSAVTADSVHAFGGVLRPPKTQL